MSDKNDSEKLGLEGVDRSSRAKNSRENTQRKKHWAPPSSLDAPPAPDGFKQRWLAAEVRGMDNNKNIAARIREGFEFVRADQYIGTQYEGMFPVIDEGRHEGLIGVGGLLLARIPDEIAQQRTDYYNAQSQGLMQAADSELMHENSHDTMRINTPSRKNRVTFGGSN